MFAKKHYWHKGDKGNKFLQWLAHLLPKKLVYFASIRLVANATQGKYSSTVVPELGAMDAIKRWE